MSTDGSHEDEALDRLISEWRIRGEVGRALTLALSEDQAEQLLGEVLFADSRTCDEARGQLLALLKEHARRTHRRQAAIHEALAEAEGAEHPF